jgi:hypothetical protein
MFEVAPVETPAFVSSLNSYAIGTPLDSQISALQTDDSMSPSSLDSVVAERNIKTENYGNSSSANSLNCMDNDQVSFVLFQKKKVSFILCWNKPIMLVCCRKKNTCYYCNMFIMLNLFICVAQTSKQKIFISRMSVSHK